MLFWFLCILNRLETVDHERTRDAVALLIAENRMLRQRLMAARPGKRLLLSDGERRRLGILAARVGRKLLEELDLTFSPETLLRWYRKLVAAKYDGTKQRGKGRPAVSDAVAEWIVRMASENESWGVRRISGALANLGLVASAATVRRVLQDAGIPPAPTRKRELRWVDFLRRHHEAIAAADFFTVEVLGKFGLVRYHVLFAIHLACRRVHIAGIVREPDGAYTEQKAREWTDPFDGFLKDKRYLIVDRGTVFTQRFEQILARGGVKLLRTPPRSPNLNAYAERFVRSIKEECLQRVIILSEHHLRTLVRDYVEHYHHERNHQGIGNQLIEGKPCRDGPIRCRERQGGLLRFYTREAA